MAQEITDTKKMDSKIVEKVLIGGNLAELSPEQRTSYYANVCQSLGLNPLTKPFDYITLNGKLTLYARKDCTEQLRSLRKLSLKIVGRERLDDVYIVTAQAIMPDGRCDESTGVVNMKGLAGDNLANAYMKAETKAKRRVTLSICGLGMLDESEVETIVNAQCEPVKRPVRKETDVETNKQPTKPTTSTKLNAAVTGNKPDPVKDRGEVVEAEIETPEKNDQAAAGKSEPGTAAIGSGKTDREDGKSTTADGQAQTNKAVLFEKILTKKDGTRTRFGAKTAVGADGQGGIFFGTYDGKIADMIQDAIKNRRLLNVTFNQTVKDDVVSRDIISIEESDLSDLPEDDVPV